MTLIGLYGLLGYETANELFRQHEEELKLRFSRRFSEDFRKLSKQVGSLQRLEAAQLRAFAIGEGGLFGTLWNLCEQLGGAGCSVELLNVPVRQEVVEICERYNENPYEVPSAGCYLFLWEEGPETSGELSKERLSILRESAMIGKLTNDGRRVLVWEDSIRYLTPPARQKKDILDRKNEAHTC